MTEFIAARNLSESSFKFLDSASAITENIIIVGI
jgi:hypothetical protein